MVFGDSLSAAYGIAQQAAWPALLAERLQQQGLDYNVVNVSISGETSAGGRARLPAALAKYQPNIVIIELGANDGLRGLPLTSLRDNLLAMIQSSKKTQAKVLLVGMRLPPNYGQYAQRFAATFAEVAQAEKLAFMPFLLEGIAERPELFQADGLHPVAAAQIQLLDKLWPKLRPLLK